MFSQRAYLWICWLLAFGLAAFPLCAQEAETEEDVPTAADVTLDDGTAPGGSLIIPKMMAMRCGISSKDAEDKQKISECFNTLAAAGNDIADIQQDVMHQLSQNALEMALKNKSAAGDYEDTLEEELKGDNGAQPGSPAAGGEDAADGEDLRVKQTQNVKISSRSAVNTVKIIDVYSTRVGLDFMEVFFKFDLPYRQTQIEEDGGSDE